MTEKLNQLKFGAAGGFVAMIFTLIFEVFLLVKFVPFYNSLLQSVYGVGGIGTFEITIIMLASAIATLIMGFAFFWLFAWVYNKLLIIKVK
ncbi:hypothetical protein J4407_01730 [Candidatus Pacearchaeota archaeon]|nr:hypothetical protein [Candidatus Pacearchaeota archaeon]